MNDIERAHWYLSESEFWNKCFSSNKTVRIEAMTRLYILPKRQFNGRDMIKSETKRSF